MRIGLTILGLVIAVGCGQAPPPQQQIDVVGIRSELLEIGKAEGRYFADHSTYATLDELQQDDLLTGRANRRGYSFKVAVDGSQGFTVTATPSDADKAAWPTLIMDQTMQITQQ
jgi:Tfp pilus assembly protein PilE